MRLKVDLPSMLGWNISLFGIGIGWCSLQLVVTTPIVSYEQRCDEVAWKACFGARTHALRGCAVLEWSVNALGSLQRTLLQSRAMARKACLNCMLCQCADLLLLFRNVSNPVSYDKTSHKPVRTLHIIRPKKKQQLASPGALQNPRLNRPLD